MRLALRPFGRTVVAKPSAGAGSYIGSLAPLGKDIVPTDHGEFDRA